MAEEKRSSQISPSRRGFLKTTGLAAIGAAVGNPGKASAEAPSPATLPSSGATPNPVAMVNILQGTDSTRDFSRGNTLPIAALPFGMAHWTLQSHAGTPWMFQPGARRIQGLRCTHQLSPWLDDYGHATFLPFAGEIKTQAPGRASSYRPEKARLTPYSLQLYLLRYQATIELVPTERCALLKATFDANVAETSGFLFETFGKDLSIEPDPASRQIRFTSNANSGGVPENFATYYVLQFAEPWKTFESADSSHGRVGVLQFEKSQPIEVRIATSFISFDQAALNLKAELGSTSIGLLRKQGADRWNEYLSRIEVEGGSQDQQRTFYSCMYRTLLFPRVFHEPDAGGTLHHYSAFNGKVEPGVMYADHGYWDVYRAWYPLMSIVFPELLGEILQAWVNAYKEGGWLPQFPAPGYRACMTGSLIDSIFGDAAAKGIPGFDLAGAYAGLKKHATVVGDPDKGFGRVGIEPYLKIGYIPADLVPQSVAETVDAAYGDFCIAQVAKASGKQDDAAAFTKRSGNWRTLFDPQVKFFRGKNADGSWLQDFDPFTWGSPYVEGAAWQHRWDAPHDIPSLIEKMGGKPAAAHALEEMLTLPPVFHVGVYGQEIHEMSEMAAVSFGQYAHSNQPVHHLLYLFAEAGRPDRTQFWVRKVMQELYSPDGYAGDEDTGAMAAWFILSSIGLYQVCPGKPEYTPGSPLFRRATVHLPQGKTFTIEAIEHSESAVYVETVSLNGKPLPAQKLPHSAITAGGQLRFIMSAKATGGA